MVRRATTCAAALTIAACSSSSSSSPNQVRPSLAIVEGGNQVDTVGHTLPVQLGAKLADAETGVPLSGRVLNWLVVDGGGSLFVAVSQTGSDGVARNTWTLGTISGGQKVVARYIDPESGAAVTLDTARATAVPGSAVILWANINAAPRPFPDPGSWTLTPVGRGQTFSLYYGFLDNYRNRTSVCATPSVHWGFSGNGAFANDTIQTVDAAVEQDSLTSRQDFAITGPDTSAMDFYPSASCVSIVSPGSVPVLYRP